MLKRLYKDCRGPVMLEFVLSCILLIVILMGIVNVSLLLKDKLGAVAAAREAGRTYAVTLNISKASQVGYEVLSAAGINPARAQVVLTPNSPGQNLVTAQVACNSPVFLPGITALLGGAPWEKSIKVSGSAIFRYEP